MSLKLDSILGPLLVGTWANSILYSVEVILAAYYYRHFKHDNWMLKLLVTSAIVIDSVSMIANYASVYLNQYWPLPLYILATGVVAALAQGFLAARYWLLTKNKFITLILFLFITVAIGGVFASAVTITIFPGYHDRGNVVIPATISLVTEAVTDTSITLALLLEFRKVKSSFKETRSLVNRLVVQTIQTGAAGSTIVLAILVTFLADNESNVPTGISYCLGRVYCLTMLANLNIRQTGNTRSSMGTSSGVNLGTHGERRNQAQSEGGDDNGGIRGFLVHINPLQKVISMGSFKTNPGQGHPDDSPAAEIEMTVNDSASYSSKKGQDLFAV
ncbi:hypothetical protein DFH09DRAFT_1185255 [Mycena vulgaris]|nr:hypothetical protein DFH09DRAFT_1185255 [Mycena vulgaris]